MRAIISISSFLQNKSHGHEVTHDRLFTIHDHYFMDDTWYTGCTICWCMFYACLEMHVLRMPEDACSGHAWRCMFCSCLEMHVLHIPGRHIDCTAYLTRLVYMIITVFHMEPWRRHLNVLQSYHFQTKVYSCNLV